MDRKISFDTLWQDSFQLVKDRVRAIVGVSFIYYLLIFVGVMIITMIFLGVLFGDAISPELFVGADNGLNLEQQFAALNTAQVVTASVLFLISILGLMLIGVFYNIALCAIVSKRDQEVYGGIWASCKHLFTPFVLTMLLITVSVIGVVAITAAMAYITQSGVVMGLLGFAYFILVFYAYVKMSMVMPILTFGITRSPVEAIKQSFALTKGNGWRLLLILVVWMIVFTIAYLAINFTLAAVQSFFIMAIPPLGAIIAILNLVVMVVISALGTSLFFALLFSLYMQLSGDSVYGHADDILS